MNSTPVPAMGPVTGRERVDVIDVLRGFALLGILAANMRGFGAPAEVYRDPAAIWNAPIDRIGEFLLSTFIRGKFVTLFALLFGVGFAIQMDRAAARGAQLSSFYPRRLVVLLSIGLIHGLLLWWGDILASYAVLGFVLLLFRKRKQKTILIWAICLQATLLVLGAANLVLTHYGVRMPTPQDPTSQAIAHSIQVYSQGSWGDIQHLRVHDWIVANRILPFTALFVLPRFLFGLWLWRSGFIRNLEARREFLRKLCRWAIPLGLAGNAAATLIVQIYHPRMSNLGLPGFLSQSLVHLFVPLLSAGYASAVALFSISGAWQWLHRGFAAIGRTALSNYLAQSLACTTLFYSYGLGLFGKLGPVPGFLPTLVVYGLQLPLSLWWLEGFQFGPVEWVWRWLTYGKKPRFRAERAELLHPVPESPSEA